MPRARQHDEARHIVIRILKAGLENIESVNRCGEWWRNRRDRRIATLDDKRRCPRRVIISHRPDPPRAQPLAALTQRLWMADSLTDLIDGAQPHQCIADRQEMLASDDQPRFGKQEMNISHAPVQRIFNRNHRTIGSAILYSVNGILERETRHCQAVGKCLAHCDMRICARRTLKRHRPPRFSGASSQHRGHNRSGGGRVSVHSAGGSAAYRVLQCKIGKSRRLRKPARFPKCTPNSNP